MWYVLQSSNPRYLSNLEFPVFANLYYEYNNDALDHRESSNLKCAVYGDVHGSAEKTNFGGQQLEAPPAGLTYVQQSSGWASKALVDPEAPEGYDLAYGPESGANNSPGVRSSRTFTLICQLIEILVHGLCLPGSL